MAVGHYFYKNADKTVLFIMTGKIKFNQNFTCWKFKTLKFVPNKILRNA
jgi:hypothetical protein